MLVYILCKSGNQISWFF